MCHDNLRGGILPISIAILDHNEFRGGEPQWVCTIYRLHICLENCLRCNWPPLSTGSHKCRPRSQHIESCTFSLLHGTGSTTAIVQNRVHMTPSKYNYMTEELATSLCGFLDHARCHLVPNGAAAWWQSNNYLEHWLNGCLGTVVHKVANLDIKSSRQD